MCAIFMRNYAYLLKPAIGIVLTVALAFLYFGHDLYFGYQMRVRSEYLTRFPGATFFEDKFAWLTTVNGELWRTEDAGGTWHKLSSNTVGGFKSIKFLSPNVGWALNFKGDIWRASDLGKSWTKIGSLNIGDDELGSGTYIEFVDDKHGWIIALSFIWKSDDGGYTWHRCPLDTSKAGHDIGEGSFLNSKKGWIGGGRGRIFRTIDGGRSWKSQLVGTGGPTFMEIFFINDTTGWANGWPGGGIYSTSDGGEYWVLRLKLGENERQIIRSIHFINPNEGWYAGQAWSNTSAPGTSDDRWGVLFHTVDGGNSWQQIQTAHKDPFYEKVYFSDKKHGWLIAREKVYRTNNEGVVWNKVLDLSN
jgi:photosystem II stability/assembly factor-like uncharacterized protein